MLNKNLKQFILRCDPLMLCTQCSLSLILNMLETGFLEGYIEDTCEYK